MSHKSARKFLSSRNEQAGSSASDKSPGRKPFPEVRQSIRSPTVSDHQCRSKTLGPSEAEPRHSLHPGVAQARGPERIAEALPQSIKEVSGTTRCGHA